MTRKTRKLKKNPKLSTSSKKIISKKKDQQESSSKKKRKAPVKSKKRRRKNKPLSSAQKRLVRKKKFKRKLKKILQELGLTILITLSLLIIVKQLTIAVPKVEGYSMLNTLMDQDRLLVSKLSKVKRFDLVYYRDAQSKALTIRRIVGLPKEQLYYKEDQLFVEDTRVPERFLVGVLSGNNKNFTEDFTLQQVTGDERIPEGKYFVLGDNRPYASDSRELGYVDEKDIVGVVKMRVMPFHHIQSF